MRNKKGFSLLQVMVAFGLVGFLSIVLVKLSQNMLVLQKRGGVNSTLRQKEADILNAINSQSALANTLMANANLESCLSAGCDPSQVLSIELRDSQNQILVPKATQSGSDWLPKRVNEGNAVCDLGEAACDWEVMALARPQCRAGIGPPCAAESVGVEVLLKYAGHSATDQNIVLKPRTLSRIAEAKDFLASPNPLACLATEVQQGSNNDGTPICVSMKDVLESLRATLGCPSGVSYLSYNSSGQLECSGSPTSTPPAGPSAPAANCNSGCNAQLMLGPNSDCIYVCWGGAGGLTPSSGPSLDQAYCPVGCKVVPGAYCGGNDLSGISFSCAPQ